MRLILSRKGFDSGTGKVASPILDDGSMVSLPIPERGSGTTYGDLVWRGQSLGDLVEQLTRGRVPSSHDAHLDPDLDRRTRPRRAGWKPSLGQCSAAQGSLAAHDIGPGDLFLFFGWFRRVTVLAGKPTYLRGAPNLHVLFGWLQVGRVLSIPEDPAPPWAADHPHVVNPDRARNTIYIAADRLALGSGVTELPGSGVFERYDDRLRLTAPGENRSLWQVPAWLVPRDGRPPLGYHDRPDRWRSEGERQLLQTVARGQEFVLDMDHYPEAVEWIHRILRYGK